MLTTSCNSCKIEMWTYTRRKSMLEPGMKHALGEKADFQCQRRVRTRRRMNSAREMKETHKEDLFRVSCDADTKKSREQQVCRLSMLSASNKANRTECVTTRRSLLTTKQTELSVTPTTLSTSYSSCEIQTWQAGLRGEKCSVEYLTKEE